MPERESQVGDNRLSKEAKHSLYTISRKFRNMNRSDQKSASG